MNLDARYSGRRVARSPARFPAAATVMAPMRTLRQPSANRDWHADSRTKRFSLRRRSNMTIPEGEASLAHRSIASLRRKMPMFDSVTDDDGPLTH